MLEIGPKDDIWYKIDAPILGTIRECEQTDFGWRGILPSGGLLEMRSDTPGVCAEIPDGGVWGRTADGRLLPCLKEYSSDGQLIGAYLIERRRRKRARPRRRRA